MASSSERAELAKLCSSRNWSKAIRILDSLLSRSCCIQDLCNRAFCYSQLELHKHVIRDCDRALELDPTFIEAYILKGNGLAALGRNEDALHVWEEGYARSVHESTDLKQLLKLEELMESVKQNSAIVIETVSSEFANAVTIKPEPEVALTICERDVIDSSYGVNPVVISGDSAIGSSSSSMLATDVESKSPSKASDASDICIQPSDASAKSDSLDETIKVSKNMFLGNNSTTNSMSLDIRLSRGIAQNLCTAYRDERHGSNDPNLLENVKEAILRITYYWYNFKPLAPRGSAVVGYTVMLGLFFAANMEVTESIPAGVQVDWEAVLSPNPQSFINTEIMAVSIS